MQNKHQRPTLLILLIISYVLFSPVLTMRVEAAEQCYNLVDETGQIVYQTGWRVKVGDQCLTAENKRYEVVAVEGNVAQVRFIEEVPLATLYPATKSPFFTAGLFLNVAQAQEQSKGKVAIYHTHSDESYVPTDGKESIYGNGGIYQVGNAFAEGLKKQGLEVIHSDAKHDPHDDMAYERSRRTAADLIKQGPDAIFDVHRDSTPPEVYKTQVAGQDVTKLQLVVGKYGPTAKQIEDYALQMKSASDNVHPGLVKGIFFAKGGDYNEDLHPRSMLVEVGSHTNDRASAERGIALFSDIIPSVLGKSGANGVSGSTGLGTATTGASGSFKSMGWIIGFLVLGTIGFLVISTGSLDEAKAKWKQFRSREFANFFAPLRKSASWWQRKKQKKDD